MTLERAINILRTENPTSPRVLAAIVFIQHESFQRAEARRRVRYNLLILENTRAWDLLQSKDGMGPMADLCFLGSEA